jgi:large conductance mechanosensitive channel
MSVVKEFREFISRGNVVDLAVGIVIGGAFGNIVSSLVADILMPPLGLVIGGMDLKDMRVVIKPAATDVSGKVIHEAVAINYGNFIQTLFDFLIIAFAIFLVVKAANRLRAYAVKKKEESSVPTVPKEVILLTEIRDLLKDRK